MSKTRAAPKPVCASNDDTHRMKNPISPALQSTSSRLRHAFTALVSITSIVTGSIALAVAPPGPPPQPTVAAPTTVIYSTAPGSNSVPDIGNVGIVAAQGVVAKSLPYQFRSFSQPSVNERGDVAFLASIAPPPVIGNPSAGLAVAAIYFGGAVVPGTSSGLSAVSRIVAKVGDTSPDSDGDPRLGVNFASFSDPALAPNGTVAFLATTGGSQALYTNLGGKLRRIVGVGDYAPGIIARAVPKMQQISSFVITNDALYFTGYSRFSGLWAWSPATNETKLILHSGVKIGGKEVSQFFVLQPDVTSPGVGRNVYSGGLFFRVRFRDGSQKVIALSPDGTIFPVLGTGLQLDGTYANWFSEPSVSFFGEYAVKASIQIAPRWRDEAVFISGEGSLDRVFGEGDLVQGLRIRGVGAPLVNDNGGVLSKTKAIGSATVPSAEGLVFRAPLGDVTVPALVGNPGVGIVRTSRWTSFKSIALPANSGPVFTATLQVGVGSIDATNAFGIWAVNSLGEPQLLIREGDLLGTRTIRTLTVLNRIAGSPAQTRSYNSAGVLVVRATFTDDTQAILSVALPSQPSRD